MHVADMASELILKAVSITARMIAFFLATSGTSPEVKPIREKAKENPDPNSHNEGWS